MSATIIIQLSPGAIALADKFKAMPQEFPQAIKRGMTRALQIVSGRIQEKRLTGHGPFPVIEHRLGERSGQLKLRTQSTPAEVTTEGNTSVITGAIGSSVKYAAAHEFGYHGRVHYTQKFRRTLFGKKVKARQEVSRELNIPERAPFRTGITENITYISDEIERELMTSLKSK